MHSSQDPSQLPSKSTPSTALADKLAPRAILGRMLDLKSANNVLQLSKGDAKAQFFTKDYFVSYLHRSTLEEEKKQWMDSPFNGNLNELVRKLKKYFELTEETTISANNLLLLTGDHIRMLRVWDTITEKFQERQRLQFYTHLLLPSEQKALIINTIKAVILSGNTDLLQTMLLNVSPYLNFDDIFRFAAKYSSWAITEVILAKILEEPTWDSPIYLYFDLYKSRRDFPPKIQLIMEDIDRLNFQSEQIQNWLADPTKVKILDNLMLRKQKGQRHINPGEDYIKNNSDDYTRNKRLNLFIKWLTAVATINIGMILFSAIIFSIPLLNIVLLPVLGIVGYSEYTRRRGVASKIKHFKTNQQQLADYTFERLNRPNAHPINNLAIFRQLAQGCKLLHSQKRLTGNIVQKLNQYCDLHPEHKDNNDVKAYLSASRHYPVTPVTTPVTPDSSYTQQSSIRGMLQQQESKRTTSATPNDIQSNEQDLKPEINPNTANNVILTVNNTQENRLSPGAP